MLGGGILLYDCFLLGVLKENQLFFYNKNKEKERKNRIFRCICMKGEIKYKFQLIDRFQGFIMQQNICCLPKLAFISLLSLLFYFSFLKLGT